jgi:hypothetical protein
MSFVDYVRRCEGFERNKIELWRHTRLLIASWSGGNPKSIIPLPGDWDDVPLRTQEERIELAKKMGVYDKWQLSIK